jgi:hypothetical protein
MKISRWLASSSRCGLFARWVEVISFDEHHLDDGFAVAVELRSIALYEHAIGRRHGTGTGAASIDLARTDPAMSSGLQIRVVAKPGYIDSSCVTRFDNGLVLCGVNLDAVDRKVNSGPFIAFSP